MKFPTCNVSFHYSIFIYIRKTEFNKQTKNTCLLDWAFQRQTLFLIWPLNFLSASNEFCCLLIIFANSLDPDQTWQNVVPGSTKFDTLDTRRLKEFYEKAKFEKVSR